MKRSAMPPTNRALPARRKGFTLTELMISLGILGIGLTMVSAAFHAGIQNHDSTVDEIIRTMIGENALAISKAKLRDGDNLITTTFGAVKIGQDDRKFPVAANFGRGFVLFGRRITAGKNDYELMVIPYSLTKPENTVDAKVQSGVTILDAGSISKILPGAGVLQDNFPVGGVVLVPDDTTKTVTVAKVTGYDAGKYAVLDKKVPRTSRSVTTLEIKTPLGGKDTEDRAEFMDPYVVRTALAPKE